MTLEERIEAMARYLFSHYDGEEPSQHWDSVMPAAVDNYRRHARRMLEEAFPELFSVPPTGWIAPLPEPQNEETLAEVVAELRAIPCDWGEDPISFLKEMRGED